MLNKEQIKLVEENYNLVNSCIKAMKAYPPDDYAGIASIALCEAAERYKQREDIKFKTFASSCIKNCLKNEFKKNKRKKRTESKDLMSLDYIFEDGSVGEYEKIDSYEFEDEIIVNIIIDSLRDRIGYKKFTILKKTLEGYTASEIAKELGYSCQYISLINKKIKNIFKNKKILLEDFR